MEAVIEKECSALGGLFQVVIGDMKVSDKFTFVRQIHGIQKGKWEVNFFCALLIAYCNCAVLIDKQPTDHPNMYIP